MAKPIERYLGYYRMRDLKENEVYFCECGCGECRKVEQEFTARTMHTPDDETLLERDYYIDEVSHCCGSSIGIWNTETDEHVEGVEYEFTPNISL